jgi:hypothetical protein
MSDDENKERGFAIPSFPIRWYLFFRRRPRYLINPRFLFDMIIRRSPILWDNFMRMEYERYGRKTDKNINDKPQITITPSKGNWRDNENEMPLINQSYGKWLDED